jgi:hypothetical protein
MILGKGGGFEDYQVGNIAGKMPLTSFDDEMRDIAPST